MPGKLLPANLLHIKDKDIQAALGRHLGILLPKRTCRRIPRILEGRRAAEFLLFIELIKDLPGHIYLSPHLQILGRRRHPEGFGDGSDGS